MSGNPEAFSSETEHEFQVTSLSSHPTEEEIFQALQQEERNKVWCQKFMADAKEVMDSALTTLDKKKETGIGYDKANIMLGEVEERIEGYELLRTPKEKLN